MFSRFSSRNTYLIIRTTDLLDKGVEVGDGVLDGGEGEEGDQVSTIGCHGHDDKQPPEAGEDPAGVRISSYNDLTIVEHQLYTIDLMIVEHQVNI